MGVIRKRGSSWQVDYRLDGKRKRKDFDTKAEASAFLEAFEKKELMHDLGIEIESVKKDQVSLKEAIHKYFETRVPNKSLHSQKLDRKNFTDMFDFLHGEKDCYYLDDVSQDLMEALQTKWKQSVKPSTVNRNFNSIRNFWNACVEWKLVKDSPCRFLKQLKSVSEERRIWNDEELETMFHELPKWAREIAYFMALTGSRPVEIANLTWADVNYSQGLLTLRCGKNAKGVRQFPIPELLLEHLQRIQSESGQIIHSDSVFKNAEGNAFKPDNFQKVFKKARERLGWSEAYVAYGIRHTFGTMLAKGDVNQRKIQALLGHASARTSENYVRLAEAAKLGEVLESKGPSLKLAR